jgi:hypothetical protein
MDIRSVTPEEIYRGIQDNFYSPEDFQNWIDAVKHNEWSTGYDEGWG